jgi:hypothetical protein
MSDQSLGAPAGGGEEDGKQDAPPYEAPRIVWREPYEPLSFGISCAHQQGNPGCNPGPFSS